MAIYGERKESETKNQKYKIIRQGWLRTVISIVGLKITVKGDTKHDQPALWVANHISWLDIPVIGSEGATFLSKSEVRQWPVIGWLGKKSGTVFIKRGGKNASKNASQQIAETIRGGDSVLIFPEGTTSDGTGMKRFHARIFAPAIDHHLPVQPIAIHYFDAQGNTHQNTHWGDESFMRNLMGILGGEAILAELTFLPVVAGSKFSERRRIAEYTEKGINAISRGQPT